ncbi:tRNA (adenosine(37)-N6)-dimethylallyltransferase MiaA [Hoeflea poritis]|uniref:tRNA dimethylallyltransferase n=1 Tax=Hoeflea poritis TaxID=2993659 RepID=A0ABT4VP03_9HYPH|nr:tRNA (adenosine(37)-N6)-dimethylallyltransferase MiaA [Hoeflea poritis]MDA4846439.1 tRNA (adenosine(37)-N6)-dimethylallyltransferase MiaA [Hoeflea poritis]
MRAVLIAGPTASGKSALALEMAEAEDGVVVNADSMQVYDTLRILTARPAQADLERAPHYLYGHVPALRSYSAGQWFRDVDDLLARDDVASRLLVFVGGTGLYFRALTDGLSEMPAIPEPIRRHWRDRLREDGAETLHARLRAVDPQTAATLDATDSQRIVRALEVFDASGQSIRKLQKDRGRALVRPEDARRIVLMPERDLLRQRIHERFVSMVDDGAIEEVERLLALGLSPDLPAMKAIGVREIGAFLSGDMTIEQAIERASIATRQYAKRQMTWFRNQLDDGWERRA